MEKRIIITGTSRGIGFELVRQFSSLGHHVLALSRNHRPVKTLNLDNVSCFPFDLEIKEDFHNVVEFVKNSWNGRADILIHNAGVLVNQPFEKTDLNVFKKVYQTNVFGVAELTRLILPYMKKNGHVVTISSMGGIQGSLKFAGLSAYSSSKSAVIALTELLAEEYKETGPQFNALALGAVQTEMLAEAFPGYKASVSAVQMATYIMNFSLTGNTFYNGKALQVSNSTP